MAVIPMCVYACMFVFLWYCVFVVRVDVGVLSQDTARCRQIPFVFVLIGHCGTVSCRQFQSISQDSKVSADPICVCVDWSL